MFSLNMNGYGLKCWKLGVGTKDQLRFSPGGLLAALSDRAEFPLIDSWTAIQSNPKKCKCGKFVFIFYPTGVEKMGTKVV